MNHLRHILRVSLLLSLTMCIRDMSVAEAQSLNNHCQGTDLVFLIDESNSMLVNDPNYLRVAAVRQAIAFLGDNVVYFCPGIHHRIAVIGFGDTPQGAPDTDVYLGNATISPTLSGDGLIKWREKRQLLLDLLPERTAYLGGTDYKSAFTAARTILDLWLIERPAVQDGSIAQRQLGIIVISDGGPCIYDQGCSNTSNKMNIGEYMNDFANYLDPSNSAFPWRGEDDASSVRVWLVAFQDTTVQPELDYLNPSSDIGSAVLPAWEKIVHEHGGYVSTSLAGGGVAQMGYPEILRDVQDILEHFVGKSLSSSPPKPAPNQPVPNLCKPFEIDPYTRLLTIGVGNQALSDDINEMSTVQIQYLGPLERAIIERGQVILGSIPIDDYTWDGPNERYVFPDPSPGTWQVVVTNGSCRDNYDGFKIPVEPDGKLVEPAFGTSIEQHESDPYYNPADPSYLRYSITEPGRSNETHNDVPIVEMSQFPISVTGIVTTPIGTSQVLTLIRQPDGAWVSTEPIRVRLAGVYAWKVTATSPDGSRTRAVEILSDKGIFEVNGVNQFGFRIVKPRQGQALPSLEIDEAQDTNVSLAVQVQLTNGVGEPLDVDITQHLATGNLFDAELLSDETVLAKTPMTLSTTSGLFEAPLDLSKAFLASNVDASSKRKVVVRLNENGFQNTVFSPTGYVADVELRRQSGLISWLLSQIEQHQWLIPTSLLLMLVVLAIVRITRKAMNTSTTSEANPSWEDVKPVASHKRSTQRRLRVQQAELQRQYDTLTKRIEALDTEIGWAVDTLSRQILQERRAAKAAERDQVSTKMDEIAGQLED